jgi:hypothetical protein
LKATAQRLAEAWVTGPWRAEDLVKRGRSALGRKRWIPALVNRVVGAFGVDSRPTTGRVVALLINDAKFREACELGEIGAPRSRKGSALTLVPPLMWPANGRALDWQVPSIVTQGELANLLGTTGSELEWLADRQGREAKPSHGCPRRYQYRWIRKRSGGSRLVESPIPRLKTIQRRFADAVVSRIPPHNAAHGFCPGRSIVTNAREHVGRRVVLKLDLLDFFATITGARVTRLFLVAGYPEPVARLMAGLATNQVPSEVWKLPTAPVQGALVLRARQLLRLPHLPQGAPTSPALANLCAYRLDVRLAKLAAAAGATYTRYADDLAFSGDARFERGAERFAIHAHAVALEEGFEINTRKTRLMRRGQRQQIAGVVVNERPNVSRADFEALKATLYNCVRHGTQGQNRARSTDFRSHLLGRISHVSALHPERGRKLKRMFEQIVW